jgi:hypothetical protein
MITEKREPLCFDPGNLRYRLQPLAKHLEQASVDFVQFATQLLEIIHGRVL